MSGRAFTAALALPALLLALVLGGLLASTAAELVRSGADRPPDAAEILFAVRLSLSTATLSSLLAVGAAIPVAYLLSRRTFPGKAALDTLLDLPLFLSPIALGAMLLVFFSTAVGDAIERAVGEIVFGVRGIILAQFLIVVSLAIRLLKETFDGIDPEYEDYARSVGYRPAGAFARAVVPMARRGIAAAFLLVWARAVGEFGATVTLAGAMPFKTATIPVAIFLSLGAADIGSALGLILVAAGIAFGVLLLVRCVHGAARW